MSKFVRDPKVVITSSSTSPGKGGALGQVPKNVMRQSAM